MSAQTPIASQVRWTDRGALAAFLHAHEGMIRARFRDYFEETSTGLFDSSDFFATVLRRFDAVFACRGPVRTKTAEPLSQMLSRIMQDAASDYARAHFADRLVDSDDSVPGLLGPAARDRVPADRERWNEIAAAAHLDPTDGQILQLRGLGSRTEAVAEALGMSVAAVRMRWHRIRGRLRSAAQANNG